MSTVHTVKLSALESVRVQPEGAGHVRLSFIVGGVAVVQKQIPNDLARALALAINHAAVMDRLPGATA